MASQRTATLNAKVIMADTVSLGIPEVTQYYRVAYRHMPALEIIIIFFLQYF